jgi:hypothetical protein
MCQQGLLALATCGVLAYVQAAAFSRHRERAIAHPLPLTVLFWHAIEDKIGVCSLVHLRYVQHHTSAAEHAALAVFNFATRLQRQ